MVSVATCEIPALSVFCYVSLRPLIACKLPCNGWSAIIVIVTAGLYLL